MERLLGAGAARAGATSSPGRPVHPGLPRAGGEHWRGGGEPKSTGLWLVFARERVLGWCLCQLSFPPEFLQAAEDYLVTKVKAREIPCGWRGRSGRNEHTQNCFLPSRRSPLRGVPPHSGCPITRACRCCPRGVRGGWALSLVWGGARAAGRLVPQQGEGTGHQGLGNPDEERRGAQAWHSGCLAIAD